MLWVGDVENVFLMARIVGSRNWPFPGWWPRLVGLESLLWASSMSILLEGCLLRPGHLLRYDLGSLTWTGPSGFFLMKQIS